MLRPGRVTAAASGGGRMSRLLAAGAMYKEVAKRLGISINTVLTYVRRIYRKLHVNSRHAAVDRFKKMR
jgi:DNA-binding CsgD family transcriptional regulator